MGESVDYSDSEDYVQAYSDCTLSINRPQYGSVYITANSKVNIFTTTTNDEYTIVTNVFNDDNTTDRWSGKVGHDDSGSTRTYWIRNTSGDGLNYAWFATNITE